MTVEIELEGGEKAEARTFEGDVLTFVSPRAFARGAPIRFAATIGAHRRAFEGRSIGSRRAEDDHFEVRMRFVNLRREDRQALRDTITCSSYEDDHDHDRTGGENVTTCVGPKHRRRTS